MTTTSSAPVPNAPSSAHDVGMTIRFGWCLDGAPWTSRGGRTVALGRQTVGPRGLQRTLAARAGLAWPVADRAERVVELRTRLERLIAADTESDPVIGSVRPSFEADSWGTSEYLLGLRDALVSAGWRPGAQPVAAAGGRRLELLRRLELAGDGRVEVLGASAADELRELVEVLEASARGSEPLWPLGVARIELEEALDALPVTWQRLLRALEAQPEQPVALVAPGPASAGEDPTAEVLAAQDVAVRTASSSWEAAEAVARCLRELTQDRGAQDERTGRSPHVTLLASGPTDRLDLELRRRGLPTIGVAQSSPLRGSGRLIGLTLDALVGAVEVPTLLDLLNFNLAPIAPSELDKHGHDLEPDGEPADSPRPVRLLPWRVRVLLSRALTSRPGVSEAPGSLWQQALAAVGGTVPEDDDARRALGMTDPERAQELARARGPERLAEDERVARDLSALITDGPWYRSVLTSAPFDREVLPTDRVHRVLDWLDARLGALPRSKDVALVRSHLAHVQVLLDSWGPEVTRRDLEHLVEATAPARRSTLHRRERAPWDVVTNPAHVTGRRGDG